MKHRNYGVRAQWLSWSIIKMAGVMVTMALCGGFLVPGMFLALWVGTTGIMLVPLAGAIGISGSVARHFEKQAFLSQKVRTVKRALTCHTAHRAHNNGRSYHSVSHSASSNSSGNSSDDGESDQSDPPGPLSYFVISATLTTSTIRTTSLTPVLYPALALSPTFHKKLNSSSYPWRNLGCWRLSCRNHTARRCAA